MKTKLILASTLAAVFAHAQTAPSAPDYYGPIRLFPPASPSEDFTSLYLSADVWDEYGTPSYTNGLTFSYGMEEIDLIMKGVSEARASAGTGEFRWQFGPIGSAWNAMILRDDGKLSLAGRFGDPLTTRTIVFDPETPAIFVNDSRVLTQADLLGLGTATVQTLKVTGSLSLGSTITASGTNSIGSGTSIWTQGNYSIGVGDHVWALGNTSVAMGNYVGAVGVSSVSLGSETRAFGDRSFAMGWHSYATGTDSVAMGYDVYTYGDYSVAMGFHNFSNGKAAVAIGLCNNAIGESSAAFGGYNQATNYATTTFGSGNEASGAWSLALGWMSHASGTWAMAFGEGCWATGTASLALGTSKASGGYSAALGFMNEAKADNQFVVGKFNEIQGTPGNPQPEDNLFVVGNGTSASDGTNVQRSNALTVKRNGNTTIRGVLRVRAGGDISMGGFDAVPDGASAP